nr:hypothetical protein [Lachnospiraceae bacterium]
MGKESLEKRVRNYNESMNILKSTDAIMDGYNRVFENQNQAENLLASGGAEDLGNLETELSFLTAMNEVRIIQREEAFENDTMVGSIETLKMRDENYETAMQELNRRKNIKSHRYDKTRKKRMETSRETMTKANKQIEDLKEKMFKKGGGTISTMDKVKSMEDIYDKIRVADRNFAEALSLNKDEEKKLKDKAELTYRSSLRRMYEREMEGINDHNSRDYQKIKQKYDANLIEYNRLMEPILRQQQVGQGQLQGPVMPGAVMQGQAGRRQGVMPGLPNQTRLRQTGS